MAAEHGGGTRLSDDKIRDEVMTLLVTALNKPANTMISMLQVLDKHPGSR